MRRLALLAALAAGCGSQGGLHVENGGKTVAVSPTVAPSEASPSGSTASPPPQRNRASIVVRLGGSTALAYDGGTLWAAIWSGGPHLVGSLIAINAAGGAVAPAIALPPSPTPYLLTAAAGRIWIAAGSKLFRVDPATGNTPVSSVLDGRPTQLLASRDALWATEVVRGAGGRLLRLSALDGRPAASVPIAGAPAALTTSPSAVWVADAGNSTLTRIDPRTERVTLRSSVRAVGAQPPGVLTVYRGSLWVYEGNTLLRVNGRSGRIEGRVALPPGGPGGMAAGSGGIWVSGRFGVIRVDPQTGSVAGDAVAVAGGAEAIATGAGSVWAVDRRGRRLVRFTPG